MKIVYIKRENFWENDLGLGPVGLIGSVLFFKKVKKIFGDTLYPYIYNVFFCDIR